MELLQLKYFCDAAQTQNFSKTARKFQVPPSDISQSIKRLEQELSVHLFTRTANRITLNERGKAFYLETKRALGILEQAASVASGNTNRGTLHVGIHINRRTVMEAIERFQLQYSGVHIVTTHEVKRENADFDVLVSDQELNLPGMVREKLFRENIVLAAQKGTFPAGTVIDRAAIGEKSFITMSAPGSLYQFTQTICRDMGFEPEITLQSEDPFYIRKCVELGLGIAFVPEHSWRGLFSEGIELWPVGAYSRDVYLYCREAQTAPGFVRAFYEMLKEAFRLG
ncbi:MAG: LysR family transcriptional regulator [Clostridia bacterium]|nr:LysR family transcriptional regulator [Clostridia bacterium]